jgi:ABC-type cobalamin/Fe3+-siderophores transport system ATPase subunit
MNGGLLYGDKADRGGLPLPPTTTRSNNNNAAADAAGPADDVATKVGVSRNVLIIGVLGSGKSTLFKCLSQQAGSGPNHSMTEETEICENACLCKEGQSEIIVSNIFDSKGFHGNWKHDKRTLDESILTFKRKLGEVNRVYFVIKRQRDTETAVILGYGDHLLSPQAKNICKFVITSCTPALEQKTKADLKAKYASFFANVRDDQFIFVNLPDCDTAETQACKIEFAASWKKARNILLDDVSSAEETVHIESIAQPSVCSIS